MAGRGSKPGERRGGRTKGTPNKACKMRAEMAARSGLLPHEFLLAVCRGERITVDGGLFVIPDMDMRIEAAKAAAPYYAPKLATIEHSGPGGGPIETRDISSLDRAKALAAVLAGAQA